MNSTSQNPKSNFFSQIATYVKNSMYNMVMSGAPVPIPGATGKMFSHSKLEQLNASRSQRKMRNERGSQPQHIKQRRTDRYSERMTKKRNSFCNNLNPDGSVIHN